MSHRKEEYVVSACVVPIVMYGGGVMMGGGALLVINSKFRCWHVWELQSIPTTPESDLMSSVLIYNVETNTNKEKSLNGKGCPNF